jgi:transposase
MWRPLATSGKRPGWLGLEGAFAHFGGIPREVLLDNAKALVLSHDIQTREVRFNERCWPLPGIGVSRPRPVRRFGRGPKARMRTAWVM